MKKNNIPGVAAAMLLTLWAGHAGAIDLRPDGIALQGSLGTHDTRMAGVALAWDWEWEYLRHKAEISGQTEVFVNHWRADAVSGGRDGYSQLGILPTLRIHLGRGLAAWYLEVGIGVSWLDQRFQTAERRFSTRFNFYDVLGGGYVLGDRRQHELGLRLVHVSNAGIKEPNPGQDFLQLRYLARF